MWRVARMSGSDCVWNVYKNNQLRGTACILDDAHFYGNIDMQLDDPTKVVPMVEELIFDAMAEEDILMGT